ncbi:hypothetical protein D3C81_1355790 [compost metagenome]
MQDVERRIIRTIIRRIDNPVFMTLGLNGVQLFRQILCPVVCAKQYSHFIDGNISHPPMPYHAITARLSLPHCSFRANTPSSQSPLKRLPQRDEKKTLRHATAPRFAVNLLRTFHPSCTPPQHKPYNRKDRSYLALTSARMGGFCPSGMIFQSTSPASGAVCNLSRTLSKRANAP